MSRALALLPFWLLACEASEPPFDETADATEGAVEELEPPTPVSIVAPEAWRPTSAFDDPFADRPADAECPFGFGLEDGVFEVDTGACPYATFVQPTLTDIVAGDTLELIFVHDALWSEDAGATAHVAIELGGATVVDVRIEIPASAGLLRPTWEADHDVPAGTPLRFHLHNHGVNRYRLVDVTATPTP